MKRYLSLILAVIIMVFLFAGCETLDAAERVAADTSDRRFSVVHFNGLSRWERKRSATNGEAIFYVDGDSIFQLGKEEPVLAVEGDIRSLTVSGSRLYVLYDKPGYFNLKTLVMYDISTGDTNSLEVDDIEAIAACGGYVFGSMSDYIEEEKRTNIYIACASENQPEDVSRFQTFHSSVTESDVPGGEIAEYVSVADGGVTVCFNGQLSDVSYPGNYIYNRSSYEVTGAGCAVLLDDGTEKAFVRDGSFAGYNGDRSCQYFDNGVVYALLHRVGYEPFSNDWVFKPTFNAPQYDTVRDCIAAHDFKEKRSCIIYETADNFTRIIGYDGTTVYLFDAQTYQIISLNPATEDKEVLAQVERLDRLSFEWCADVLFIYEGQNDEHYDEQYNVVGIVEAGK